LRALARDSHADFWSDASSQGAVERGSARPYLDILRRHALLIASIAALAFLVAVIYVTTAERRYTAHAQVVVNPLPPDDTTFLGIGGLIRDSVQAAPVVTAAQLLDGTQVRHEAAVALGPHGRASFRVTPLGQSNVVDIAATSSSAEGAARAANVYARTALRLREIVLQDELTASISRLQARLAVTGAGAAADSAVNAQINQRLAQLNSLVGSPDPTLALLSRAAPPTSASWPRTKLSLLVALVCGLLLGALVAVLVDRLDRIARRPGDLLGTDGSRPFFRVPNLADEDLHPYVCGALSDDSRHRDAFRLLRSAFRDALLGEVSGHVVAVCSTDRNEGRSLTAVGLAKSFADADRRVVLVDGDMGRAGVTAALGASNAPVALPDVLRDSGRLHAALVGLALNVWLLPAAADPTGPDVAASGRLQRVLDALREEFDLVILDTPPFGDAHSFSEAADGVLLCGRLGQTDRVAFREALERLADGAAPVGIVVVGSADTRGAFDTWTYGARRLTGDAHRLAARTILNESLHSRARTRIRPRRRQRSTTGALRPPPDLP